MYSQFMMHGQKNIKFRMFITLILRRSKTFLEKYDTSQMEI